MKQTMKHPPIARNHPRFLHGGDYNPDQWLHMPEIIDEDFKLMKSARCNTLSVAIFAWAALEPEEGVFRFDWLDGIMDRMAKDGMAAVLATPTGARPPWMAQKYPEVLRVTPDRVRNLFGARHNHCYTSPVYREKTRLINTRLAERYRNHPALAVWHVSNEYGGECHCDLCQAAFREWLKVKFGNDLDRLNRAWWTSFWSHTYTEWTQIESPCPRGETMVHGQVLDWKRFVTHQTVDFMRQEIIPLKSATPSVPVTTNLMGVYKPLDYWKFRDHVDVISWDSYPQWHSTGDDVRLAAETAFTHDQMRSLKQKPFMLMESTPSTTNWRPAAKLKRPGMHKLSSLQAVAHGADTVQYFQWRKGAGGCEKFHGAVVDHSGSSNTRVFRDVAEVGELLGKLGPVLGTSTPARTAIIFDRENRWALDEVMGLRNDRKDHDPLCFDHYQQLWAMGLSTDVISMDEDFSRYRLLVAPMLYMVRPGVAERIEAFVRNGGTFVTTFFSGIADENDNCFLGGFPGPLRLALGIVSEEIDTLGDGDRNRLMMKPGNFLGLKGSYAVRLYCDLIRAETAQVLAEYKSDFYAKRPVLTRNHLGKGQAFYIAAYTEPEFLADFYGALVPFIGLEPALKSSRLPAGVNVQVRTDGREDYVFVMNFNGTPKKINLSGEKLRNFFTGKPAGKSTLEGYGLRIFNRKRAS